MSYAVLYVDISRMTDLVRLHDPYPPHWPRTEGRCEIPGVSVDVARYVEVEGEGLHSEKMLMA